MYFVLMILKTLEYPFGQCLVYEKYAHCKFFDSVRDVPAEYGKQIVKDLDETFGNKKYVLISERGLNTRVEPSVLKLLNLARMKALAIVSPEGEARREELVQEQQYFKGSFAFFTNFEAAKDWALTFIEED